MEALGIDSKLLLAQIVNFIVLFFIFKRFISKPFFELLAREKKKEQEKARIILDLEKKEEQMKGLEKEIVAEANVKATKIIEEAKKLATITREDLVKKAHAEVMGMHEKAAKQIEDDRNKLYAEVRQHLVETSAQLTKAVLAEVIDTKTQEEIVKKVVSNLDKKALYEN